MQERLIDTSGCGCGLHASEAEHWHERLKVDFVKIGVAGRKEFLKLCALRLQSVPDERRTDYRWLHYERAEFLKQWAQEDNRALLDRATR
ncbi:MAG: hypothetical protein WCC30_06490 [Candidatus Dormiibacterota bacterium]